MIEVFVEYQDSARTRPAEELVRRYENRIESGVAIEVMHDRIHIDFDVRGAGCVVEAGDATVAMHQASQLVDR